jgi:hypothetical protein
MIFSVFKVNGKFCVCNTSGTFIFNLINRNIIKGENICLDFDRVKIFSAVFFNAAIGRLFKFHSSEVIEDRLSIINLDEDAIRLLNLVKRNSQRYYTDAEYRAAVDKAINNHIHETSE